MLGTTVYCFFFFFLFFCISIPPGTCSLFLSLLGLCQGGWLKVKHRIISHKFLYPMYCVMYSVSCTVCTVLCMCHSTTKVHLCTFFPSHIHIFLHTCIHHNLPSTLPTSPYSIKPLPPHPPPNPRRGTNPPIQLVKITDSTPP